MNKLREKAGPVWKLSDFEGGGCKMLWKKAFLLRKCIPTLKYNQWPITFVWKNHG